jgi:uncharacterized protein YdeI (YjbR/CyaY-like superfamily)
MDCAINELRDHMSSGSKTLILIYLTTRQEWRLWLAENAHKAKEIWFVFPKQSSSEPCVAYNDAVEEALCYGWIDSTIKTLDESHRIQRFSPRKKNSTYSRANVERLIWLESQGLLSPEVQAAVQDFIHEPYVFPTDILNSIQEDSTAWSHFCQFPPAYQRIRIAYIDGARKRPDEFKRRLASFIRNCSANKMLGYGGIEKYYLLD